MANKIKKLKKNPKESKSVARKESEMECFRRIKPSEIPISDSVDATALKKILTNPASTERERVIARVLLSPQIQKTITKLTDGLGVELVTKFLKENEKNIKNNLIQKLHKGKGSKKKGKDKKAAGKKVSNNKKVDSDQESDDNSEEERDGNSEEERAESDVEADSDEEMASERSSDHETEEKAAELYEAIDDEPPVKALKLEKKPIEQKKASKSKRAMRNAPPPEVKKSADPFFISSTGENYLASVNVESDESEDESNDRRKPKFDKPRKFQGIAKNKQHPKSNQKPFQAPPAAKPQVQPKPKPVQATAADVDIHPSWKAKSQMRKVQIQDFQGTKIKFDD